MFTVTGMYSKNFSDDENDVQNNDSSNNNNMHQITHMEWPVNYELFHVKMDHENANIGIESL